jgi:hypothetical protein
MGETTKDPITVSRDLEGRGARAPRLEVDEGHRPGEATAQLADMGGHTKNSPFCSPLPSKGHVPETAATYTRDMGFNFWLQRRSQV